MLNSSLFEQTVLQRETAISIGNLDNNKKIKLYNGSETRNPLECLLQFLNAYDFSSEGSEEIREENRPFISVSVLGLIFEKINGYKGGSFFTPGFITMFMVS